MASTAVKLDGGVSAGDGAALAREMRCEPEFLLSMRKRRASTEFACFVRNVTPTPVALSVPFGQMEGRPKASEAERGEMIRPEPGKGVDLKPELAGGGSGS